MLQSLKNSNVSYTLKKNSYFDLPLGRKTWNRYVGSFVLTLSNCEKDEFTCDDGKCIKLKLFFSILFIFSFSFKVLLFSDRCNVNLDCEDNSDEQNCSKVNIPENYAQHLVPKTPGKPLTVYISVKIISISSIETTDMKIYSNIALKMRWYDFRYVIIERYNNKHVAKHMRGVSVINPNLISSHTRKHKSGRLRRANALSTIM